MKSTRLDPDEKKFLRDEALRGWEIVEDLQAALDQFSEIAATLSVRGSSSAD
ncbi:MAG: hypothetical protein WBQ21_02830 [Solirubrobacteraceae bacterium]